MDIKEDFKLSEVTTFHLPAKTKYYCEYDTIDELIKLLRWNVVKDNQVFHIGGGSNLVFTKNFDGVILHSKIEYLKVVSENDNEITFKVGSGVNWDDFVSYCVDNGYYGAENMSYIPGEVGASAIQNIGSYGMEVKDIITKVHAIEIATCKPKEFLNADCHYGYRDSIFKNELKNKYIITAVEYTLSKIPKYTLTYGPLKNVDESELSLEKVRNIIIDVRKAKLPDPLEIGSAGSFFKNPIITQQHFNELLKDHPELPHYAMDYNMVKVPAGWLIEHTGLKGIAVGDAQVYPKQCLVIVNNGRATGCDVVKLYNKVIAEVKNKFAITLEPEANIL